MTLMPVIKQSEYLLPGQIALKRAGKIVWVGPISAPWEDAVFDTMILSKPDYDATALRTLPDGRRI